MECPLGHLGSKIRSTDESVLEFPDDDPSSMEYLVLQKDKAARGGGSEGVE